MKIHIFHKWSQWRVYTAKDPGIYQGKQIVSIETRQTRYCVACGYTQDRFIKDGEQKNDERRQGARQDDHATAARQG